MDPHLLQLIRLFQSEVTRAIELFQSNLGLQNYLDWRKHGMERQARLGDRNQYFYSFHGKGCLFKFSDGESIDWDWGHEFRNDGFDLWRLNLLRTERKSLHEWFPSKEILEVAFVAAKNAEEIVSPWRTDHDNLFYVAKDVVEQSAD